MLERVLMRCPAWRTVAPLAVLWAPDDVCPSCSGPLAAARRRPGPTGVLGKTLALLHAQAPDQPPPGGRAPPVTAAESDPHDDRDRGHAAVVTRSFRWADEAAERADWADAPGEE